MGKFNLGGILATAAGAATGNPALIATGVGSILSDRASNKAIGAATDAQVQAAQIAADTQLKLADKSAERQQPFVDVGLDALTRYQELLGLVPAGTLAQKQEQRRAEAANAAATAAAAPVKGTRAELLAQGYKEADLKEIAKGSSDIYSGYVNFGTDQAQRVKGSREELLAQGVAPHQLRLISKGTGAVYEAPGRAQPAPATTVAPPLPGSATLPAGAAGGQPAQTPQSIEELIRSTPGYQFSVDEEERAIERAAAGRGQRLSGNVLEELASRAGNRALGTVYNNQLDRLAGLAGMGQNAASNQGTGYLGVAGGVANAQLSRGSALAGGRLASGAVQANSLQGLAELVANRGTIDAIGDIFTGGGYTGKGTGDIYSLSAGGGSLNLGY